jgi:hypothetical protein
LELDLPEVLNQNSSRSRHAVEHDTAQSRIGFLQVDRISLTSVPGMSPGRDICHAGEGTLEANMRVRPLVLLSVLINIKLINNYFLEKNLIEIIL